MFSGRFARKLKTEMTRGLLVLAAFATVSVYYARGACAQASDLLLQKQTAAAAKSQALPPCHKQKTEQVPAKDHMGLCCVLGELTTERTQNVAAPLLEVNALVTLPLIHFLALIPEARARTAAPEAPPPQLAQLHSTVLRI